MIDLPAHHVDPVHLRPHCTAPPHHHVRYFVVFHEDGTSRLGMLIPMLARTQKLDIDRGRLPLGIFLTIHTTTIQCIRVIWLSISFDRLKVCTWMHHHPGPRVPHIFT
ncbi:hypothetical protein T440DRAFT_72286 [Plenodomus tracheiphilus IPT5]|uniref:Uncharacterized protein n=1 Tax=Plenodomus tracheiphilus IPT5 TaxID=1408161 RepID=A0A6A7BA96_9PLEO|nr:hypothetical protein T440DRAFT_72286 [Plenodomus tracheiphilus IPT5]